MLKALQPFEALYVRFLEEKATLRDNNDVYVDGDRVCNLTSELAQQVRNEIGADLSIAALATKYLSLEPASHPEYTLGRVLQIAGEQFWRRYGKESELGDQHIEFLRRYGYVTSEKPSEFLPWLTDAFGWYVLDRTKNP